ncbi:MAG: M20/M25/M40 family metallo-hydrolase [Bacillota bacterium]
MPPAPEQILSDLVRIDSTNPPGNEIAVANYLKKLFENTGANIKIIEPEKGRSSFIARLGSGSKKLLYLSHSDVVPAGDDWDFKPFSGEVKEGFVHGRGSLDCKDLLAAQASAALQLLEEKVPLQGELIIAAVADEEAGGRLGAGYLTDKHSDLIEADFAVNEGADHPIILDDRMLYFLQVGEKGTAWCKLKAYGRSGHGSIPTLADNALVKISRAVTRLYNYRSEVILIPEVKKLLKKLAELSGIKVEDIKADQVDKLLDKLPFDQSFIESLRSMTRMTISPNIISGGMKTNIVPDYCEADIDIRILPGQDCEYVESELRLVISKDIDIEFTEYRPPTFSSSSEKFYKLMEETTLEMAGDKALCLPIISAGSTDSKYIRSAGIPAYGVGHMAEGFDPELRTTVHGRNERTDIDSLLFKTEFFKRLAQKYLQ